MPNLEDVRAALDRIGRLDTLWPDFEPEEIPLMVWDGVQTTLFQASAAPAADWQPCEHGWALPYRHPAMVANTAVTLENGVETATVLLTELPDSMALPELAALIVHERFHVYQSTHRPERWQADELAVFGYPLTAPVLASRRLELLALRLALTQTDWRGHAAEALNRREVRWKHLTAAQQELERGLERREGLAYFLELKVSGRPPVMPLPDFAPTRIRQRCYSTGAALGLLLSRTGSGTGDWPEEFMQSQESLEELLSRRLEPETARALSPAQVAEAEAGAVLDVQAHQEELRNVHAAFLGRPGSRLTISTVQKVWPQGFDPLNMTDLGGGRILHGRFLRFGNAELTGEVLGNSVLTQGSGPHPMQGGFNSLTFSGLHGLRLYTDENTLHVEAQGVGIQIRGAYTAREEPDGWAIALR